MSLGADATFSFEKRDYNEVYAAVATTVVLLDGLIKSEESQSLSH